MAAKTQERRNALVEEFVASFARFDEMRAHEVTDPVAWALASGPADAIGRKSWHPLQVQTDCEQLNPVYGKLPAKFPKLYEQMVLSYRWAEVDLGTYRLVANPPGADLSGLLREISRDSGLWDSLLPAGFIRFGKGPDMDYDPVCFDIKKRTKNGDYRVVKIDHEEILCNCRVKVVAELAPSFEELMRRTIERARDGGKV